MNKMNNQEAYADGVRIGYWSGYGRADQYILGEEVEKAWDEIVNIVYYSVIYNNDIYLSRSWERGYQYGYRLAAEGNHFPKEFLKNDYTPLVVCDAFLA